MHRIEESIEIDRSADKVFAYTTDPTSWPAWQPFPKAEQSSPGPMAVGSTTTGTIRMMGLTRKWTAEVTEYAPDEKFGKRVDMGAVTINQRNTYRSVNGGTRLTIRYDMTLAAVLKPLSPIFVRSVRGSLVEALRKLKENLETSL